MNYDEEKFGTYTLPDAFALDNGKPLPLVKGKEVLMQANQSDSLAKPIEGTVRPHQPGAGVFKAILFEDIDWFEPMG